MKSIFTFALVTALSVSASAAKIGEVFTGKRASNGERCLLRYIDSSVSENGSAPTFYGWFQGTSSDRGSASSLILHLPMNTKQFAEALTTARSTAFVIGPNYQVEAGLGMLLSVEVNQQGERVITARPENEQKWRTEYNSSFWGRLVYRDGRIATLEKIHLQKTFFGIYLESFNDTCRF